MSTGYNSNVCGFRRHAKIASKVKSVVSFAGGFAEYFHKYYGCKQLYSQTPLVILIVAFWMYSQTPPSLRATSPNLGEEPGYSADVNTIILSTRMLTCCWLSNEQGN